MSRRGATAPTWRPTQFLSILDLSAAELAACLDLAAALKAARAARHTHVTPLTGLHIALLFDKPSLRTRSTFTVAVRELGGDVLEPVGDVALGGRETIEDVARNLERWVFGAVIRTFGQDRLQRFAAAAPSLRLVNALTDEEHPCQILSDLQTIQERLGTFEKKVVTFIGDGACNVPRSWMWAAARLEFQLRIAAPEQFQPDPQLVAACGPRVSVTDDLAAAAEGADVLYTDVWVSMGKESEEAFRLAQLAQYQINAATLAKARPGALVMHCLPAYRGKEITEDILEGHAETIFAQAENRLHAQKAVLAWLAR